MGCDIHVHTEIKINGKWEHYDHPRINRSYGLFSKIAGVRNNEDDYIVPIAEPKGLPYDLSVTTALEYKEWEKDAHSETWLNVEEISELEKFAKDFTKDILWQHKNLGYLFGNSYGNFFRYRDNYPEEVEDVRLICWFDN